MPGYIIHLAAARELQPFLERAALLNSPKDTDQFTVSCLIPDGVSDKRTTHYRQTDDSSIQMRYPQPWRFCNAYPQLMHTPAGIGFLFHLYVDFLFYQEYFPRHILLTDQEGNPQVRKDKIQCVILKDFHTRIPADVFFGQKYLYDDYTIINACLEKNYRLCYDLPVVENPGFREVDYHRIHEIQKEILHYSALSRQIKGHTRALKIEPLLDFIQQTAPRFLFDYNNLIADTATEKSLALADAFARL